MPQTDPAKIRAAQAAAALVAEGMTVGLGSGTTASLVIGLLGERLRAEGLHFVGVSTSEASATLARAQGIALRDIDSVESIDVDIDGADEVDPQFRLIKGRGGALLREKIVASASRKRVIVIAPEKRVDRLGRKYPVPLEVTAFGISHTARRLQALGARPTLRLGPDGNPLVTDGGHRILDCHFGPIDDPAALDRRLRAVIGVFETGLFLGLCDLLVVGHPDRAELVECPVSPARST
jgi:ribose 5-phosphate isomerase A